PALDEFARYGVHVAGRGPDSFRGRGACRPLRSSRGTKLRNKEVRFIAVAVVVPSASLLFEGRNIERICVNQIRASPTGVGAQEVDRLLGAVPDDGALGGDGARNDSASAENDAAGRYQADGVHLAGGIKDHQVRLAA